MNAFNAEDCDAIVSDRDWRDENCDLSSSEDRLLDLLMPMNLNIVSSGIVVWESDHIPLAAF